MVTRSRRAASCAAILAGLALATAGCSSASDDVVVSDDSDQALLDESRRLADLFQEHTWVENPRCNVRVMRQDGETSWGLATCVSLDSDTEQAEHVPIRVDGDTVSRPRDGSYFADDLRELFPDDLAEKILSDSTWGQPESESR